MNPVDRPLLDIGLTRLEFLRISGKGLAGLTIAPSSKGVVVYPILPLVHHRMVFLISQISELDVGILQHQV